MCAYCVSKCHMFLFLFLKPSEMLCIGGGVGNNSFCSIFLLFLGGIPASSQLSSVD